MKERLDVLLVEKGLFPSREKAKASIMAGLISVDGLMQDKAGTMVDTESDIHIKEDLCPYVSRGGLKLEKAIECFGISTNGKVCADMGASTGGFTDCMLKGGAVKVYSIDVGYGQLDYKLRNDPRVVNMERTNIRYMDASEIEEKVAFISIDVSFISLGLILPKAVEISDEEHSILCLVKPQFEAGREQVGKGGIVRDRKVHKEVIEKVIDCGTGLGLAPAGLTYSPIKGAKGNIEYLLYLKDEKYVDTDFDREAEITARVDEAHDMLASKDRGK